MNTEKSTQPIIVIYHSADFDGLFCREIARLHFGDAATYIGWNYGDPVPEVPVTARLYILDLSVRELMAHPGLIWIDHHKSAIEEFPITIPGYRIDGVAACRLAWQWFAGEEFGMDDAGEWGLPDKRQFVERIVTEPLAVRLAGEYDIWDHRDARSVLFQHGLRFNEEELDWPRLLAAHEDDEDANSDEAYVSELLESGRGLERYLVKSDAKRIKKSGFDLRWEGLTFLAINAGGNSLAFAAGIKPHHDALLGFRWAGDKWLVSLYGIPGKPDLDLSAIAVRHGGGGHRQACGFECATLPFEIGSQFSMPEAFLVGQQNLVNTLIAALNKMDAPEDVVRALAENGDVAHVHWWISKLNTTTQAIFSVIGERERQNAKWGEQNHDPITWSAILTEECGEFAEAALHKKFGGRAAEGLRMEAVHCAAVAVQIVECIDRAEQKGGE
jgi:NTP pyrophosphatase (non-canonical NTP hydrolase)